MRHGCGAAVIVEVVAVGTELLLGQIVNTNAAEIGRRLAAAGLDHYRQVVVGDNLDRVTAAVSLAVGRSDAVILTGGIGPTQDDLTREALCAAAAVEMAFSDAYAQQLHDRWFSRWREMPMSNLRQAEHPTGAELLDNPKGTAPGLRMRIGGTWVFALPGVPQEMVPMIEEHVIPFLVDVEGGDGAGLVSRIIRTWGESEARIGELLGDLFEQAVNPTIAFLAGAGEIKVRLTARAPDADAAASLLDPLQAEVARRLGSRVFAIGDESIEQIVLRLAGERGWGIGTAESATGGMVAARLTAVPGASAVFRGAVVAYAGDLKSTLLSVPSDILGGGVVSEETALGMAAGGAEVLGADVVVAVTGSAGPAPQEQPVGTMVIAVRTPDDARARTMRMMGDRERARAYTSTAALHSLRQAMTGAWWRR